MRPRMFDGAYAATAFIVGLLAANSSFAAQRTFVASTGSDANLCSLPQPCRSFNAAIAQTNAGGEVVILDTAAYGAVTITKSVKILAPAGVYGGVTVFGGTNPTAGIVIDAAPGDATTYITSFTTVTLK